MNSIANVSMAQRAAVIISILGEEVARPIIENLDDDALERVEALLDSINSLPVDQTAHIIIDFLEQIRGTSGALMVGKNQVRQLITSIEDMRRTSAEFSMDFGGDDDFAMDLDDASGEPERSVWERLADYDDDRVAAYLGRLTPNLCALVLRQMTVTQCSNVLSVMDDEKLPLVMDYLVDGGPDDPAINSVIEQMIDIEFLCAEQDVSDTDREHLQQLGELLSLIPADKRDKLVKFLETEHEGKLHDIQKSLFTIEGLPDALPRNAIPVLFRELKDGEDVKLIASLRSENNEVAEFLLGNISSRQATQIREDLDRVGKLSDEEVEDIQRNLLLKLMALKRDGVIVLV